MPSARANDQDPPPRAMDFRGCGRQIFNRARSVGAPLQSPGGTLSAWRFAIFDIAKGEPFGQPLPGGGTAPPNGYKAAPFRPASHALRINSQLRPFGLAAYPLGYPPVRAGNFSRSETSSASFFGQNR